MNKIINQLTTSAEIVNYLSFLNPTHESCFEQVQRKLQLVRKQKLFLDQVQSIRLSEHAAARWNERVGPCVTEAKLVGILNSLLQVPGSIRLVNHEEGRIDDDIVFTYFIEEGQMVITTFYGRISLRPALNNLNLLKRFNHNEHDSYNLGVSVETLNEQLLPLFPKEIIKYKGSKNVYLIEKYTNTENKSCLFFYKVSTGHVTETIKIDPTKPERALLTRRTLYILFRLGYEDFVLEHLMFHKPEAVQEVRSKALLEEILSQKSSYLSTNAVYYGMIPYAPIVKSGERVGLIQAS
ncbi:hypothetical protein [Litchfieldia alkalitelluris]|uniref:hypothetical protein n=1 Tax=Litchfieldia alkalitelluris TaxID=304268 RepID=UPI0009973D0D|nr:hypothetical protein [Litchfieldia alkalitelluris]